MEFWMIGALANTAITATYLAIALIIFRGIGAAGQWRANPLALATGCIFFTCSVSHGLRVAHLLLLLLGVEAEIGAATRQVFSAWHISAWDSLTAAMALWYFSQRRISALVRGAQIFEDVRVRQGEAFEIHDNVVQRLANAKMALDSGETQECLREVETTLAASRKIISDLMGDKRTGHVVRPGDLRRQSPAGRS